jgi:hypothetical protein
MLRQIEGSPIGPDLNGDLYYNGIVLRNATALVKILVAEELYTTLSLHLSQHVHAPSSYLPLGLRDLQLVAQV